ncbi:hypothetical protein C2G38_1686080 [Gigaspora rosea]|uniref:Uncharacterized protein n=1 Tax=Gigaspora rosea TaxID=44941 RepID=A0A397VZ55_9GLOM|nr:hypothetical protein C2G38_1686080 [Gigaspora rosea]
MIIRVCQITNIICSCSINHFSRFLIVIKCLAFILFNLMPFINALYCSYENCKIGDKLIAGQAVKDKQENFIIKSATSYMHFLYNDNCT